MCSRNCISASGQRGSGQAWPGVQLVHVGIAGAGTGEDRPPHPAALGVPALGPSLSPLVPQPHLRRRHFGMMPDANTLRSWGIGGSRASGHTAEAAGGDAPRRLSLATSPQGGAAAAWLPEHLSSSWSAQPPGSPSLCRTGLRSSQVARALAGGHRQCWVSPEATLRPRL